MEAKRKEFSLKFKKEILAVIFLGIITLVIASILDPDRSDQIFDTLKILGVLLVIMPLILILYRYSMEDIRKSKKKSFSKG